MNFTQLTLGVSPTKRQATKTLLFIYWKVFSDMSKDLCPNPVTVHGLCLF